MDRNLVTSRYWLFDALPYSIAFAENVKKQSYFLHLLQQFQRVTLWLIALVCSNHAALFIQHGETDNFAHISETKAFGYLAVPIGQDDDAILRVLSLRNGFACLVVRFAHGFFGETTK